MKKVEVKRLILSIFITSLVIIASLLGILTRLPYAKETENWALQAVGQDWGNLIAVSIFIPTLFSLSKNIGKAYFIWLGSLFYFIYAYIIYAFYVHFNFLFPVYVAVLGLSFYALVGSLMGQRINEWVKGFGAKKAESAAWVLIITGAIFVILWLSEIIPALLAGGTPASLAGTGMWVNPIQVIDLSVVLPGMIMTGVWLLKRKTLGYFFAGPWLIFSILMGSSIVVTMIMELSNGNMNGLPPLIMVGIVVSASATALYRYLRSYR